MVEVGVGVGVTTLCCVCVLLWRIWIVENTLNERIDEIDHSLAVVVGGIIEKLEHFDSKLPEINLIQQDPLAQLFQFFSGQMKNEAPINSQPDRSDSSGQYIEAIEVEANATKEEANQKTPE